MYHFVYGFVLKYRKLYYVSFALSALLFFVALFGIVKHNQANAVVGPSLEEYGVTGGINSGAVSARWVNATNIEVTIGTKKLNFTARSGINEWRPAGQEYRRDDLVFNTADHPCFAKLVVRSATEGAKLSDGEPLPDIGADINSGSLNLDIDFAPRQGGQCTNTNPGNIDIGSVDTANALAFFRWVNVGVIETVDGSATFERPEGNTAINAFTRVGDSGCSDIFILDGTTAGRLYETDTKYSTDLPEEAQSFVGDADCDYNLNESTTSDLAGIPNDQSLIIDPSSNENSNKEFQSVGSADGGQENPSCETQPNPLSWFLCPVFNGLVDTTDWIFRQFIEPYLAYSPIDPQPSEDNVPYRIWSSFRLVGNIILALSLIVALFGQSIGGGMIDAYTAKKMLPRILMAAILVNLSIYFVAFAADAANVLGKGIGLLITAPLDNADALNFKPGATEFAAGFLGLLAAIAIGIWTAVSFRSNGQFAAGEFMIWILMVIMLPVLLVTIAIFVTLIIRRSLMLLLAVISPVAFALYVIPSTEKYFKKWWETFAATLLVYPIVVAMFAVADVMFALTRRASSGVIQGVVGDLVSFVILFIPLAAIPFAFKLAGGLLGGIYGAVQTRGAKAREKALGDARDPHSMRARMLDRRRSNTLDNRARASNYLKDKSSDVDGKTGMRSMRGRSKAFRRAMSLAQRGVAIGDLDAQTSERNERVAKTIEAQTNTGADTKHRGFFARRRRVNRVSVADADGNVKSMLAREVITRDADGMETGTKYFGEDGKEISGLTDEAFNAGQTVGGYYENLDGGIVSDADFNSARAQWGRDTSAIQQLLYYELGKAPNDKAYKRAIDRFMEVGKEIGLDSNEMNAIWASPKFRHKGARLDFKHTGVEETKGPDGKTAFKLSDLKHAPFSQELADSTRSFDYANYRPSVPASATQSLELSHDAVAFHNGNTGIAAKYKNEDGSAMNADQFRSYLGVGPTEDVVANKQRWSDIRNNYLKVAANIRSTPNEIPDGNEGGIRMPGGGTMSGTQVGGSARAKAEWDKFAKRAEAIDREVNPGNYRQPTGGPRQGGGGGAPGPAGPTGGGGGGPRPTGPARPSGPQQAPPQPNPPGTSQYNFQQQSTPQGGTLWVPRDPK